MTASFKTHVKSQRNSGSAIKLNYYPYEHVHTHVSILWVSVWSYKSCSRVLTVSSSHNPVLLTSWGSSWRLDINSIISWQEILANKIWLKYATIWQEIQAPMTSARLNFVCCAMTWELSRLKGERGKLFGNYDDDDDDDAGPWSLTEGLKVRTIPCTLVHTRKLVHSLARGRGRGRSSPQRPSFLQLQVMMGLFGRGRRFHGKGYQMIFFRGRVGKRCRVGKKKTLPTLSQPHLTDRRP